MDTMEIRSATVDDAEKITDLLLQLGYPHAEDFVIDRIIQLSDHPDAELAVAVAHDAVVGFISIHFVPQVALPGDFARISYLCVDAAARCRGTGRLLEAHCLRLAKERGCDRIELHCDERRQEAPSFYRVLEYRESPRYFCKPMERNSR